MKDFTKEDLLLVLNIYQNHINDFVNISEDDLDEMLIALADETSGCPLLRLAYKITGHEGNN